MGQHQVLGLLFPFFFFFFFFFFRFFSDMKLVESGIHATAYTAIVLELVWFFILVIDSVSCTREPRELYLYPELWQNGTVDFDFYQRCPLALNPSSEMDREFINTTCRYENSLRMLPFTLMDLVYMGFVLLAVQVDKFIVRKLNAAHDAYHAVKAATGGEEVHLHELGDGKQQTGGVLEIGETEAKKWAARLLVYRASITVLQTCILIIFIRLIWPLAGPVNNFDRFRCGGDPNFPWSRYAKGYNSRTFAGSSLAPPDVENPEKGSDLPPFARVVGLKHLCDEIFKCAYLHCFVSQILYIVVVFMRFVFIFRLALSAVTGFLYFRGKKWRAEDRGPLGFIESKLKALAPITRLATSALGFAAESGGQDDPSGGSHSNSSHNMRLYDQVIGQAKAQVKDTLNHLVSDRDFQEKVSRGIEGHVRQIVVEEVEKRTGIPKESGLVTAEAISTAVSLGIAANHIRSRPQPTEL
jgi:hypothetical protein